MNMNDITKELQLFFLLFIPGFLGLIFRPSLFGFDGYATYNGICNSNWSALGHQPVTNFLFGLMPCSVLVFKLFSVFSAILTLFIVYKIVLKYFDDKVALQSTFLLMCLSPIVLFEFAKFENELFAYPLIVLGIYYFLNCSYVKGLVVWLVSLLFWVWPFYFQIFNTNVLEHQLFGGLLPMFFLILVFPFVFFMDDNKVRVLSVIFLGMFLLNSKFFIFLLVFLAISIGVMIQKLVPKVIDSKTLWGIAFFLLLGWNYAVFVFQPTNNDWFLIDSAIKLSEDKNYPIYNDWSYGHWLESRGYLTKFKSGGVDPSYYELQKPFVALTNSNLDECVPVKGFSSSTRSVNVWLCE